MKIEKHMPKAMSGILCFTLFFGSLLPTGATDVIITETPLEEIVSDENENNVAYEATDNIIEVKAESSRYEEKEVTYNQPSSYFVTIPKTITLGADKSSPYSIKVEGDIAASRQVCVVPIDGIAETEVFDFYMSDQIVGSTKSDVVAEISQTKFYWNYEDVTNGYEETENYIVAEGLSAGRWKGTFQMEISMRTDPAHIHNYVGEVTKEPTCTDSGEKTYTCVDCGDSYTETVDPAGHHYEDGKCTDCGEKDPDHQHSYTEEITKEPTCTEMGEKTLICNCGDTKTEIIPATGHIFVDGECTDCGGKDPDYHRHSYTEAITKEPACTEAGEKTYTCTCGDSYIESIPATGHSYGDDDRCTDCGTLIPDHQHSYTETVTKEPTCAETGEKILICICGDTKTESIPAKGHNYGEDDKCTDCGELNPDHMHSYTEEITKEPTCTEAGEKTLICVCGDSYTESISATGHNYVETGRQVPNGIDIEKGIKEYTCLNCGHTYSEEAETSKFSGLYDENDVLLASWDELINTYGMVLHGNSADKSWQLASIIKNNEELSTGTKLIIGDIGSISDSKYSIGAYAFENCTTLTDIIIPEGVTYIRNYVFNGCSHLTNIVIPDTVHTISECAFAGCSNLKMVYIPSSVTAFSNSGNNSMAPFLWCSSELKIYCGAGKKPSGYGTYWNYYKNDNKSALSVTWGVSRDKYNFEFLAEREKEVFDQFSSKAASIEIPEGVKVIPSNAFENFTSLKSVTIPSSVTIIGDYTFSGCTSLTDIEIPDGVTSIGKWAFKNCGSLSNIMIPDSVKTIGSGAFYNNKKLVAITLPDGLTTLEGSTFSLCSSLNDITIPDSVTSISGLVFNGCTSLRTIYIPDSVLTITASSYSGSPFYSCSSTLKIYCGANAKQSGWGTYWNYYASGKSLSVTYDITREQYESTYKQ